MSVLSFLSSLSAKCLYGRVRVLHFLQNAAASVVLAQSPVFNSSNHTDRFATWTTPLEGGLQK